MATGRGDQEGSVLFNLGQTVQADGTLRGLRVPGGGGPGGGWRLSEVDSVLVGGTRGPAPHTEITLNRTMQGKD